MSEPEAGYDYQRYKKLLAEAVDETKRLELIDRELGAFTTRYEPRALMELLEVIFGLLPQPAQPVVQ